MTAVQPLPRRTARRRRAPKPLIVCAAAVIFVAVLCSVLGRTLAPYDPSAQDLLAGLQLPSVQHPFGTDNAGRDILSRLMVGTGRTMLGPLIIAAASALIASVLGLVAGYRGGWVDSVIMRGADLLYAFPALLAAIVLIGVIGGGYLSAVFIMVLLTWPADVRIVRGATLDQRNLPYVDAARTLGLSQARVIGIHIWPNVLPLIVTNAFLNFAYGLVALSSLSFLGLGVEPGAADWGLMISENLSLLQANPVAVLAPGLALVLVAVSMNLLGDDVYERLQNRGRAR